MPRKPIGYGAAVPWMGPNGCSERALLSEPWHGAWLNTLRQNKIIESRETVFNVCSGSLDGDSHGLCEEWDDGGDGRSAGEATTC